MNLHLKPNPEKLRKSIRHVVVLMLRIGRSTTYWDGYMRMKNHPEGSCLKVCIKACGSSEQY